MPGAEAESFRSGFVGIVGKPNVGKSTILNALLGRKLAIISPRPQTTRHRVLGVLTREHEQAIFLDSPGWHRPKHPLGRYMMGVARGILQEADVLVAVIDATSGIRQEDEWVFDEVRRAKRPAMVAINKVDLVKKPILLPLLERCAALGLFAEHIPMSAVTKENLDVLLEALMARLPTGPRWYEPEQLSDQSTEQLIREFIREQVLCATRQEVPQVVAVLLDEVIHEGQTRQGSPLTTIHATIVVEQEGQKAIVIGHKGAMLKKIGTAARLELERLLGRKVFLQLWVKVYAGWRKKPEMLRSLGYES